MIQECCVCKTVYGEKEPLDNRSKTHGYCKYCHEAEMFKQAAEIVAKVLEKQPDWIQRLRCMRKFFGVACTVWELRGFLPKGAGRAAGEEAVKHGD